MVRCCHGGPGGMRHNDRNVGNQSEAVDFGTRLSRRIHVGECVPFTSVLVNHAVPTSSRETSGIVVSAGQEPILHLCGDLFATVAWAHRRGRWWAFTPVKCGCELLEDRNS